MFKKFIIVIVFLFFFLSKIEAYEYINPENESSVNDMIERIYDAKEQYESLAGGYEVEEEEETINYATSDMYWWPIGSDETTTSGGKIFAKGTPKYLSISSPFGYRKDPLTGQNKLHGGIDIPNNGKYNVTNIIAANSGIVVFPTSDINNNCPSGSQPSCGNTYGNYIIIQHNDGNYTLYAHLYEGSILVKEGDAVEQGQVIAKMGSSGSSTGAHLHFEVREGSNAYTARVNPTKYVHLDNPRGQAATITSGSNNKQTFCLSLKKSGYSDSAVIAIMHNVNCESGINPKNMENSYEKKLGYNDDTYTKAVDSGKYKNFINDSVGYGLAQWTYWSRKKKLLKYSKEKKTSISDMSMQYEFFIKELQQGYPGVDNYLKNVSHSYKEKVYYFCKKYERPAEGHCEDRRNKADLFKAYVENGCQ